MIVECPGCQSRYDVTGRPPGTEARCRCGKVFTLPRPGEEARALTCPQCGAGVSPDRTSCEHCRSVLSVVACPRCFGRIFSGAKHCQHCGAKADAPARAWTDAGSAEGARRCPRCTEGAPSKLVAQLVGGTMLDACHRCGGVWVDAQAFEQVMQERDRQAAIQKVLAAPTLTAARPGSRQPVTYLKCLDCGQLMNRQNFGKVSGVIVDTCKAHGVWFDCDELEAVLAFVAKGGLDKARQAEVEAAKQEVESLKAQRALAGAGSIAVSGGESSGGAWRFELFGVALTTIFRWLD